MTLVLKWFDESLRDDPAFENSIPVYTMLRQKSQTLNFCDHDVIEL